ncbi:MAG TPA: hypothetical protein VFK86_03690 [Bauldia sp.]|nr:hypothetical protein [Bauldia sp.]
MVEPSGSEASALATSAVLVELIRTLHAEGVLEGLDIIELLTEAKTAAAATKSAAAPQAVEIIKAMLHEYGQ